MRRIKLGAEFQLQYTLGIEFNCNRKNTYTPAFQTSDLYEFSQDCQLSRTLAEPAENVISCCG
jgi:hypothetical protein